MPDKQHTSNEHLIDCDVVVIGAGPGGYSAAFRCADLGLRTVLVERHATLGGVCLNVGCIPSKALLHVAAVIDEAGALAAHGVNYGAPQVDRESLASWKQKVVGKLTTGLAAMAKMRKVTVLRGEGRFIDAQHLTVQGENERTTVAFGQAIIATGSRAVTLPFLPEDPRIVTSTGALALDSVPKRMLVIGGGIIGLELATVYAALGSSIDVVEMQDGLMAGADRDLVKVWEKHNAKRFDRILLNTRTVGATALPEGILVSLEGPEGALEPQLYDLVLVAIGRRPNEDGLGAAAAGVTLGADGFIPVDEQMRTNIPHIFAIGDVIGQPMLAHKAVHEAHLAAEVAAGLPRQARTREIPSVAYTDPEVAWVGVTEESARRAGRSLRKAVFPWAASGRAIANGREEGFTKLLVDPETLRIVGGGIVGTHAGDLIGELCLAIQMGCTPQDLGHTIHPHPTLCESVGLAAEVFEGVCTDLPPQRRS
jgi:dihydrolipoamide dehydrogenase